MRIAGYTESTRSTATIIMGLPFAFVMILVMWSLHRALEGARTLTDAMRTTLATSSVAAPTGTGSWRRSEVSTSTLVEVRRALRGASRPKGSAAGLQPGRHGPDVRRVVASGEGHGSGDHLEIGRHVLVDEDVAHPDR